MSVKIHAQVTEVGAVQLRCTLAAWEGNIDAQHFFCNLDEAGRRELVTELDGPRTLDGLSADLLDLIASFIVDEEDALQPRRLDYLLRTCKVMYEAVKLKQAAKKLRAKYREAWLLLVRCDTANVDGASFDGVDTIEDQDESPPQKYKKELASQTKAPWFQ